MKKCDMLLEEPTENYAAGWIKLFRSTQNKAWYRKPEYLALWVHLLFKANHKGKSWLYKNQPYNVKRGQFITSRDSLVKETGIERNKIERILKCFENEQQIEQQNLSTSRLISIINYDTYQNNEQDFEQRVSSKRAASEQRVSTTKECKNVRIEEEIPLIVDREFEKFKKWISDNAALVAKMKEPFTEEQFRKLKSDYTIQEIQTALQAMHNWKPLLTKRTSAYLTCRAFIKNEKGKNSDNVAPTLNFNRINKGNG